VFVSSEGIYFFGYNDAFSVFPFRQLNQFLLGDYLVLAAKALLTLRLLLVLVLVLVLLH
jgi:hypothetical protein